MVKSSLSSAFLRLFSTVGALTFSLRSVPSLASLLTSLSRDVSRCVVSFIVWVSCVLEGHSLSVFSKSNSLTSFGFVWWLPDSALAATNGLELVNFSCGPDARLLPLVSLEESRFLAVKLELRLVKVLCPCNRDEDKVIVLSAMPGAPSSLEEWSGLVAAGDWLAFHPARVEEVESADRLQTSEDSYLASSELPKWLDVLTVTSLSLRPVPK